MDNMNCAVIAEPPICFPWGFDEEDQRCAGLKLLILNRLSYMQTEGVTRFFIPIDAGFGLYTSELVVSLMETDKELQLYSLISYEEQAVKWSPELRNRYYSVLEKCTEPVTISVERTPTCELDAMLEAIDRSSRVLAVCAGKRAKDRNSVVALRYAQKNSSDIQSITTLKSF